MQKKGRAGEMGLSRGEEDGKSEIGNRGKLERCVKEEGQEGKWESKT